MEGDINLCARFLVIISCILVIGVSSGCSREDSRMEGAEGGHREDMAGQHEGAHEGAVDEHGAMMERQHQSMVTLQEQWVKAKGAVAAGETSEAAEAARKMDEATAAQQDFMLHRNPEGKEDFLKQSREFRSLVMRFMAEAEKGNKGKLREIAPKIDEACNTCHNSFR